MKIEISNDELIDLIDNINSEKELISSELMDSKILIDELSDNIKDLKEELAREKQKTEFVYKKQMTNTGLSSPSVQFAIIKKLIDVCINSEANPRSRRIPMIKLIRDLTQCNIRVAKEFVDQFYRKFTGQIIMQETKQLPQSTEADIVSMPIVPPSNIQN